MMVVISANGLLLSLPSGAGLEVGSRDDGFHEILAEQNSIL